MEHLDTPILFLVFNRPDETKQVFETIRKAKPKQLFIAADGARVNFDKEPELCSIVKEIVADINWDCVVKTLFRSKNLGCGKAVSEAITWFFEHVEMGIILEDDCICDESFFSFASELLIKYRTNDNIMHISANGPLRNIVCDADYSFIKYPLVWGWATWRRSWEQYDYNMKCWPSSGKELLNMHFVGQQLQLKYWTQSFQNIFKKNIDTWDYQWAFACLKNNGLCVFPHINLVSNIGFGLSSTHTTDPTHPRSNMPRGKINLPIAHSEGIALDDRINRLVEQEIFDISMDERLSSELNTSKMKMFLKNFIKTF